MIPGIIKLAVLVVAFLLAVFMAFQLLEINMDFGTLTCENDICYKGTHFCLIYCFIDLENRCCLVYIDFSLFLLNLHIFGSFSQIPATKPRT